MLPYTGSLIIINDYPIAVGVENPHKFWMCRSLATLDKLVDRFPLGAPPIGDTSLTHVMRLAAHSLRHQAYCDGIIIYKFIMLCTLRGLCCLKLIQRVPEMRGKILTTSY
jgi:hypothetical protein